MIQALVDGVRVLTKEMDWGIDEVSASHHFRGRHLRVLASLAFLLIGFFYSATTHAVYYPTYMNNCSGCNSGVPGSNGIVKVRLNPSYATPTCAPSTCNFPTNPSSAGSGLASVQVDGAGSFVFEYYHNSEYWGFETPTLTGVSTTRYFTRAMPYASSVQFKSSSGTAYTEQPVFTTTTGKTKPSVAVVVPDNYSYGSSTAQITVALTLKNPSGTNVRTFSETQSGTKGQTKTFTFPLDSEVSLDQAGEYKRSVTVTTNYGPGTQLTDSWALEAGPRVEVPGEMQINSVCVDGYSCSSPPEVAPSSYGIVSQLENVSPTAVSGTINFRSTCTDGTEKLCQSKPFSVSANSTKSYTSSSCIFNSGTSNYRDCYVKADISYTGTGSPKERSSNVRVTYINQPPSQATIEAPTNGATDASLMPTLKWNTVTDPEGDTVVHKLHFGDSISPSYIKTVNNIKAELQHIPPSQLVANKKYYWRVDTNDGTTDKQGILWSFTTAPIRATTLTVNQVSGTAGTPVTLAARLSDTLLGDGYGISGRILAFSVNGQTCPNPTQTDSTGFATCSMTIDQAGNYMVAVSYAGDAAYAPSNGQESLLITESSIAISFIGATVNDRTPPSTNPIPVLRGQRVTLDFELKDQNQALVDNASVGIERIAGGWLANTPEVPATPLGGGKYRVKFFVPTLNGSAPLNQYLYPKVVATLGSLSTSSTQTILVNPPDYGVTVVMHGFQFGGCTKDIETGSYDTNKVALHEVADAILERAGAGEVWVWDAANDEFWFHRNMGSGGGEKIILVDWGCTSNNPSPGHAESTAHALYAALKTFSGGGMFGNATDGLINQLATSGKRLHVVSHSFGTVVGFEFLRRVRHLEGIQNIQFTTLDPHDFSQSLTPVDGSAKLPNIDIARLDLPLGVFDNYYQTTTRNITVDIIPYGRCIDKSFNRYLDLLESDVHFFDPTPSLNHSGVWFRYLHTVLPDKAKIDTINRNSNWFSSNDEAWTTGYNFSQVGGGVNPVTSGEPATCNGEDHQLPETDDVEVMNGSGSGSALQTWRNEPLRYLLEQGSIFDADFLSELDDSTFRPGFAHASAITDTIVNVAGLRYAMLAREGKFPQLMGTTSVPLPAVRVETHATFIPPTINSLQFRMAFSTGSRVGAVPSYGGLSTLGNIPYNGSPAGQLLVSLARPIWASATNLAPTYNQINSLSLESFPSDVPNSICIDIPQEHRNSTRLIKLEASADANRVAFIRDLKFSTQTCFPSLTVSSNSASVPSGGVAIAFSTAAIDGATSLTTNASAPAYKVFGRGSSVTLTAPALDTSGYPFASWSYCDSTPGIRQCTVLLDRHRGVEVNYTPSPGTQTNGVCGSASGILTVNAPEHSFCLPDTAPAVTTDVDKYTWTCSGANGGQSANCQALRAYIVTPAAGANGTVSPNTSQAIKYGTSHAFTVTPSSGYTAAVSGCAGSLGGNIYTTGLITSSCEVSFTFAQAPVSGTPPTAPTIGTATTADGSISVAFTPGDIGSGALVNHTADCGGITNTGASSPITVSGLTNGITYTCKVKTTSTVGSSGWSLDSNPVTPGVVVNGACGTAHGSSFSSAPTTNLCAAGAPTPVTGSDPWAWSCNGANGGTNANCSAAFAPATDTTPDQFTFTGQTGVELNTVITSNPITVSGINAAAAISVSGGGSYSIDGGVYTSGSGTVSNGQTVTVRVTSSSINLDATLATLNIGGVSDTFSVTTKAAVALTHYTDNGDGTVTDTNTGLMWMRCSMGQTWDGSTCAGTASTHTWDQAMALTPSFASHADWRMPSKEELLSIVDTSNGAPTIDRNAFPITPSVYFWSGSPVAYSSYNAWSVGFDYGYADDFYGRSSYFGVRLVRGGQSLGFFALTVQPATGGTVSSTDGINCGATCSKTYYGGTSVTLTATSASGYSFGGWGGACSGANPTCMVTMDAAKNVTAAFAPATDTTPDPFTFTDQTNAEPNTVVTSNSITVSGINAAATISVSSGGSYSINGGAYTGGSGTVSNGSTVTVRVTSSASNSSTTLATLTIGGVSDTFSVTTKAAATYAVTASANPAAGGTASCSPISVAHGGSSACTATENSGYTFSSWTGDCAGQGKNCTLSNITSPKSSTANYSQSSTYTLNVNASGATGVAISASPSTYAGTTNYSKSGIASGTAITLTAPSTSGSHTFSSWSGCDTTSGTSCTVAMNAARSVTAGFQSEGFTPTSAFTDNGDGTVTHQLTGLTWMRCSMGQTWTGESCSGSVSYYAWDTAKVLSLEFAGYADWRLPTPWELVSITDFNASNPKINSFIFPTAQNEQYWTSSQYGNDSGWVANYGWGGIGPWPKSSNLAVRLVRGGNGSTPLMTPTADFVDNGDGTVTHKRTGLTWMRCSLGEAWSGTVCTGTAEGYTFYQFVSLSTELKTFAGLTDWRLPSVQELSSIVEYGTEPALNTSVFPSNPWGLSSFWSSTESSYSFPDKAWAQNFYGGLLYDAPKTEVLTVRLVRGVQQSLGFFALTVQPATGGTVSSTDGINCGATCSKTYSGGTTVTLTATPASGYSFGGWGGACSGSGTNPSCTVTMDAAKNVTTAFASRGAALFSDDFSADLAAWVNQGGNWAISNGKLAVDYDIGCGSVDCPMADMVLADQHQPTGDYQVSVEFSKTTDPRGFGWTYAQFGLWESNAKKIAIGLGGGVQGAWGGPQTTINVDIQKWNSSWSEVLPVTSFPYAWDADQPQTATLKKVGNVYSIYINGTHLTDFTDDFLLGAGKIGLHSYGPKLYDNFRIMLPGVTYSGFTATVNSFTENDNLTAACQSEFGIGARLADWGDLVAFYQAGGSISGLFAATNWATYDEGLLVSNNGQRFWDGSRHYFAARHDGHLPTGYSFMSHANIGQNLIDLGSWYGLNNRVLCYQAIGKANQTIGPITFAPTTLVAGGTTTASASATSGLAVTFISATQGICSASGSTITGVAAGICTIAARQAGNANYNAAPQATQNITVTASSKLSQTIGAITFSPAALAARGITTASATATSGLTVRFASTTPAKCTTTGVNGRTITGIAAGTCTIIATQAGNASYNAAPQVTKNIAVAKAGQTIGPIAFAPATLLVGGTTTANATATSGLAVTFSTTSPACTATGTYGRTVTGVAAGTCIIKANQAGNASYNAAPVRAQTLTVGAAAAPAVSLNRTALIFAARRPGTTSPAQTVTLRNTGTAALGITGIAASGDFARTTACGAALAAGASCTVSATFTPTATGARTGLVTITSNATGSPHRIALTGTGQGTRYDLNGDGKADIFWRNTASGANQIWFMNGAARIGAPATPIAQPAGWSIAGEADFNADGKADLLWRNAAGQNQIWLMNGAARLSAKILSPAMIAPWIFAGTGDFNNDGKADLFWRNTATGANRVWLMNGAARIGAPANTIAQAIAWAVAGIADFNGDGKADILWRNAATGQNQVWFMNGAIRAGAQAVPGTILAPWIIAGTGDFNNDGRADLLWRNPNTGGNTVWFMNGAAATGTPTVAQAAIWQAAGVADFSGDGKADILWRNPVSGATQLWLMNGAARGSFANLVPAMPVPWVVAK